MKCVTSNNFAYIVSSEAKADSFDSVIFKLDLNSSNSGWEKSIFQSINYTNVELATAPSNSPNIAFKADGRIYFVEPTLSSSAALFNNSINSSDLNNVELSLNGNSLVAFGNSNASSEATFSVSSGEPKVIRLILESNGVTGYLIGDFLYAFTDERSECQFDGFLWKFNTQTGIFTQVQNGTCKKDVQYISSVLIDDTIYLLKRNSSAKWLDKMNLDNNTWNRIPQLSSVNGTGCLAEFDGSPAFLDWPIFSGTPTKLSTKINKIHRSEARMWGIIGASVGAGLAAILLIIILFFVRRGRNSRTEPKSRHLSFNSHLKNEGSISLHSEPSLGPQFEAEPMAGSSYSTILSAHGTFWDDDDM